MVLEADGLGCAREVIVITAALSIQDPRERPAEQRAQADQLHARFTDPSSDFLTYVNLWGYVRSLGDELSRSQLRKRCKAEFLHYLRIREWQDLVAQLEVAAAEVGLTLNEAPAEGPQIHGALLSGLLSHLGVKDAGTREYTGARGAKFAIFPGSALARRGPSWVMVAELVETTRLWGRTAAATDVTQVEPLAEHLVKRSYGEPRWDRRRAAVVASEQVTLYGLPIVDRGPSNTAASTLPPRASCSSAAPSSRATGTSAMPSCARTSGGWRRSRLWRHGRDGVTCSPARRGGRRSSTNGYRRRS